METNTVKVVCLNCLNEFEASEPDEYYMCKECELEMYETTEEKRRCACEGYSCPHYHPDDF